MEEARKAVEEERPARALREVDMERSSPSAPLVDRRRVVTPDVGVSEGAGEGDSLADVRAVLESGFQPPPTGAVKGPAHGSVDASRPGRRSSRGMTDRPPGFGIE